MRHSAPAPAPASTPTDNVEARNLALYCSAKKQFRHVIYTTAVVMGIVGLTACFVAPAWMVAVIVGISALVLLALYPLYQYRGAPIAAHDRRYVRHHPVERAVFEHIGDCLGEPERAKNLKLAEALAAMWQARSADDRTQSDRTHAAGAVERAKSLSGFPA